jgi:hypothetical protein
VALIFYYGQIFEHVKMLQLHMYRLRRSFDNLFHILEHYFLHDAESIDIYHSTFNFYLYNSFVDLKALSCADLITSTNLKIFFFTIRQSIIYASKNWSPLLGDIFGHFCVIIIIKYPCAYFNEFYRPNAATNYWYLTGWIIVVHYH